MSEKTPSKADALRAMREANYAAKSSVAGSSERGREAGGRETGTEAVGRNPATATNSDLVLVAEPAKPPRASRKDVGRTAGSNPATGAKFKRPAEQAKPKFDRNEAHRVYMREYMRKRRQAEKREREREK